MGEKAEALYKKLQNVNSDFRRMRKLELYEQLAQNVPDDDDQQQASCMKRAREQALKDFPPDPQLQPLSRAIARHTAAKKQLSETEAVLLDIIRQQDVATSKKQKR